MRSEIQKSSRRIVIKIGTSSLADAQGGLDRDYVARLCDAVARECARGREIVIVTSGAIGAGLRPLGLKTRPRSLRHLQAAAAVGQVHLVHAYEEALRCHGLSIGQVLLTRDGLESRFRYLNARNTLTTLLESGAVPVVNENDTVSVEEIRFGDNDTLAALVTKLIDADLLVILTDVEGLYTCDPRRGEATLIKEVPFISDEIDRAASGAGSCLGSGGMVTKLRAARKATAGGAAMVLASGADPAVINRLLDGEDAGTFFAAARSTLDARRFWIAFGNARSGAVRVNAGARKAMVENGKSLLPVGVTDVVGNFRPSDTVSVTDEAGEEFARGVVAYSSASVRLIMGRKSTDLPAVLGADFREDEVIHRDNLVLMEDGRQP